MTANETLDPMTRSAVSRVFQCERPWRAPRHSVSFAFGGLTHAHRETLMAKKTNNDPFAALREAETNGDNYDISTADIIARLKKWQKLCDFRLTEVDYNTVTLKFDTLPDDIEAFVRDAYDLCPDLVQVDEDSDLELLKKNLPKTKKMMLWWD